MTASCMRLALLLAAIAATAPASAQSMGAMKDGPIARFTEQDMQLFTKTLNGVLDDGADDEVRSWSNPDTKARGEVKVIKSFERAAAPCRRVAIKNEAKGRSASSQTNFCKQSTGKWAPAS